MIDPRFYTNTGPYSLGDIADKIGGQLQPPAHRATMMVGDLASLEDANETEIVMFGDRRYREAVNQTKAGVVVTTVDLAKNLSDCAAHVILVPVPRQAWAEVAWLFYPRTTEAARGSCDDSGRAAAIANGAAWSADTARDRQPAPRSARARSSARAR